MLRNALLNITHTENGALTFKSTIEPVLDFYYHAPAKRGLLDEVLSLFQEAYADQPALAILALFNLRDVRGGKGERGSFRACLKWLAENDRDMFKAIAQFVPEYGRWDDLTIMVDQPVVRRLVRGRLNDDCSNEHPSLLAKWMPSLHTSSPKTRQLAHAWRKALGMTEQQYRQTLAALRRRIRIVEQQMSAGKWSEINYSQVPSRAAMIYRNAFARHDKERYQAFLDAVARGESEIKSGTLYPYELVHAVQSGKYDQSVQALWDALPDYTQGRVGLVVADVSGSMMEVTLHRSKARPIDVSVALAIYYAQRNKGPWTGMAITFTDRPSVIEIPAGLPLNQAIQRVTRHVGYNTNFQAVFELILEIAQRNRVPPDEMPAAIWVISDMEFDVAGPRTTNLDSARQKYATMGYPMPAMVFWNVASRGMQTPATANEQGVVLVSGFSQSAFQSALENTVITPREAMLRVLLGPRYAPLAKQVGLIPSQAMVK